MNITDLSLEEQALHQDILENKQYEMAVNLISELLSFIPELSDLSDELNGDLLLDALGCAGLSLTVGEYASRTFFVRSRA
jgi:hypothetical protein